MDIWNWFFIRLFLLYEPYHDKTNKMTCAPSEDSDQPGHLRLRWAHISFCWFCHEAAQIIWIICQFNVLFNSISVVSVLQDGYYDVPLRFRTYPPGLEPPTLWHGQESQLLSHKDDTLLSYGNGSQFLDRQIWANSVDPSQTAPQWAVWSGSTLLAILSATFGHLLYG